MNRLHIYITSLMAMVATIAVSPTEAQNKRAVDNFSISTTILDEQMKPIVGAEVSTREGASNGYTSASGEVAILARKGGIVLVEAEGYKPQIIELDTQKMPEQVILVKEERLPYEMAQITRADNGKNSLLSYTGAASIVTGSELKSYPDYSLSNTLEGRLAGLEASQTVNGLANNVSTLYVRGMHRDDTNTVMVIVDGMERNYDDILPEEIETITVLKDAMGKILYGARATNGVVVITTRRGTPHKRKINATIESGVSIATRSAEYLNSYDYATLYNEARQNDGLSDYYSAADLEGYLNSTGENDLYYPNVDYSDFFLDNTVRFTKGVIDMTGGNDKVQYSMVLNYVTGNGYEAVGPDPTLNRISARGNLDVKITNNISFVANAVARFEDRKWGNIDCSTLYTRISTYRPNEAPLTISAADMGLSESSVPYFGASRNVTANLLADLGYGGDTEEHYISSQTNLGLRFDLDEYVKGLSFGGDFMFDNYDYLKIGQTDTYATYALIGTGSDGTPTFQQVRNTSLSDSDSRESYTATRTTGYRMMANYSRQFGLHEIDAAVAYNNYYAEATGQTQDVVNAHTTARLSCLYDNRYSIEGSVAYLQSNRYSEEKRGFLSSAVGAAWILSNESFMANNSNVNLLKLKASFGHLGYDAATDYLLHVQAYGNLGTTSFGEANSSTVDVASLVRVASDIDWEYSNEFNIGLEGYFFGGKLGGEINYFHETRKNMVSSVSSEAAGVTGTLIEVDNLGSVRNQGIDLYASYMDRKGDFGYSVGLTTVLSKNKVLSVNEVDYPDANLLTVGQSTSTMYGYVAEGLFGKDVELEGHAVQELGDYGVGDIAYKDLNNDGVIDTRDRCVLGSTYPTATLGLDVNLTYKGWGLYLLGTAELGASAWLNNSYYWVDGTDKYSTIVLDRYHPENNPDGWYPSLTTYASDNNFVNSSYWLESAAFFRMKNAQLSYTFEFKSAKNPLRQLKVFVNGTNLFVLSKIKDLDPEVLNAGVTNYPLARTITGGISASF